VIFTSALIVSTCAVLGTWDGFGDVPFDSLTGEAALIGTCEEGDCRLHDRYGVNYDLLDGRILAKVVAEDSEIGFPYGILPGDTLAVAGNRLAAISSEAEVEFIIGSTGAATAFTLICDGLISVQVRFREGSPVSVGLYTQP
jgi:hypothetical protein